MAINQLLFKYKGNRCAGCGLSADEMLKRFGVINKLFQFHHVDPAKKHADYDNLIQRRVSAEQLDELDKCVLLCNNCHDILHAQRGTGTLHVTCDLGNRTVVLPFKGQVIVDFDIDTGEFKARFFQDEPMFLERYDVSRDTSTPETFVGAELNTDGRLLQLLLDTQKAGTLRIRPHGHPALLLKAEKVNQRQCKVVASVQFPLLKFNGFHDDHTLHLSVRNGQVIYSPKKASVEVDRGSPSDTYTFHVPYAELRKKILECKAKSKD
jgi:hypothetical protein